MDKTKVLTMTQGQINRLSPEEYEEYVKAAEEMGLVYRFDGSLPGPETANLRFFGDKNGKIVFDPLIGWVVSPVLVKPDWDLRPLQCDEQSFRILMGTLGVPKNILDNLINGQINYPTDLDNF